MASKDCYGCKFKNGEMRTKITIETLTETKDDTGAGVTVWSTFCTVWAAAEVSSGRESLIAQRIDAEDIYKFTIRYFPGITEKMRIPYAGRNLQIKSVVDPDLRKNFMVIKAIDEGQGT